MTEADNNLIDGELTEQVIGCAINVQRTLGPGFLEKVYENALFLELRHAGVPVKSQVPINAWYREQSVGNYVADLIVDQRLLIELKATRAIDPAHVAQTLNDLRATRIATSLILNFGQCPQGIKRLRF